MYSRKIYSDKCIVLDVDETLVYTAENYKKFSKLGLFSNSRYADLRVRTYRLNLEFFDDSSDKISTDFIGIIRPHAEEFLEFCFKYFKVVAIWSAGQKSYVEKICDFLFRNLREPDIIWTRNDCDLIENEQGQIIGAKKPLEKMYKAMQVNNSDINMNEKNTYIIDDRLITFQDTNPKNGILIPSYHPKPILSSLREDDTNLLEIQKWLMEPQVRYSKDIRNLSKNNIFSHLSDTENSYMEDSDTEDN